VWFIELLALAKRLSLLDWDPGEPNGTQSLRILAIRRFYMTFSELPAGSWFRHCGDVFIKGEGSIARREDGREFAFNSEATVETIPATTLRGYQSSTKDYPLPKR
jgi:hypothetical protein